MIKEFKKVEEDAEIKYESKRQLYAESWKTLPLWRLRERLRGEIHEWRYAEGLEEYNELLDIINIARMLAKRIDEGATD